MITNDWKVSPSRVQLEPACGEYKRARFLRELKIKQSERAARVAEELSSIAYVFYDSDSGLLVVRASMDNYQKVKRLVNNDPLIIQELKRGFIYERAVRGY